MNLRTNEAMESGSLPQHPGEPDCSYYIRTGLCRFGSTCRFNHPPNRELAIATARIKGEYPERVGQPECQYYLKTGTCKFGATCKFNHPRDKAGIAGRVSLNILGYPLRPNEIECGYYLRTGQCKFGGTCKFNHPQPTNMMVSLRGSPVYPTIQSPTTPGQQSYAGGITNWSRASFIPSPRQVNLRNSLVVPVMLSQCNIWVVGTMGYAAPEYVQTGRLAARSDVWSYGVFLYELITGRPPVDRNRPKSEQKLLEWVRPYLSDAKQFRQIVDPRLEGKYSLRLVSKLATVANRCLVKNPKKRPKMSEVLEMVSKIVDASREAGSPRLSLRSSTSMEAPVS